MKILAIGDSKTAAGQWQIELTRLLNLAGITHTIATEAVGGTRTNYWPSRIGALLSTHQPDLVVIAAGTNDDPTEKSYGEVSTGWAIRALIEAVHAYRPASPALVLPALISYSDPLTAPDWLLANEPKTNDVLWPNIARYWPPNATGWLAGIANLQRIPANLTYLDTGGIHPNERGYKVMARILYDAAQGGMGWPACSEPPICGLYGRRRGDPIPSYIPCP